MSRFWQESIKMKTTYNLSMHYSLLPRNKAEIKSENKISFAYILKAEIWSRSLYFLFLAFFFIFLNSENMLTHLQETWKLQNRVTYRFTIYYHRLSG